MDRSEPRELEQIPTWVKNAFEFIQRAGVEFRDQLRVVQTGTDTFEVVFYFQWPQATSVKRALEKALRTWLKENKWRARKVLATDHYVWFAAEMN